MKLIGHFRKWFGGGKGQAHAFDAECLRAEFKARYSCFRELLSANKKALESFAALELAGQSGEAASMEFLRRHGTAAAVGVQRMINSLEALAPGRYQGLIPRFREIRLRLEKALEPKPRPDGPLVMRLDRLGLEDSNLAGPKMASLGMLASGLGLEIPRGFVITTAAYELLLEHNRLRDEIARLLQIADMADTGGLFEACSEIQSLFLHAEVPPAVADEVEPALGEMLQGRTGPLRLAVRSSAVGEDRAGASFAGQFASELNVDPRHWREAYLQVAASLYGPSAVSYRMMAGLKDQDAAMAVGCLAMVDAVAGGVAYTADPSKPDRRRVYVESCWGLPKAVVDGAWDCDRYEVEPGPPPMILEKMIAPKEKCYRCDPVEGILPVRLEPEQASAPSLEDGRVLYLAGIALGLDRRLGGPRDIEWALGPDGGFCILQCRDLPMAHEKPGHATGGVTGEELLCGGVTASPGVGSGRVRWVRTGADALIFKQGEILAVENPLPRWAPLLGKASAVISPRGGITGHLASVAREFGLPALFGLGPPGAAIAPETEITVDAGARTIYRGKAGVAGPEPCRPSSLPPSPVDETLSGVLELTAPLNLLDPEADSFTPGNCRTLHDLTRFCHQKAVEEMFSRAAGEFFPANAARRLFYKVPMQWWILDLGDGVKAQESKGDDVVRLEDIVSRPFKAFWEGMTEIPWAGPPSPSAGGMAAVMFRATRNPAMGNSLKASMQEKNYFLIGRDFMNMQSRIGFHFTTLEASTGEESEDNFVSFCFRGGAADFQRRAARLVFLEELLANLAMAGEMQGDALLARAESLPDAECLALVKALGYLTMHMRQLDMIMLDKRLTGQYRAKLESDLSALKRPACGEPAFVQ